MSSLIALFWLSNIALDCAGHITLKYAALGDGLQEDSSQVETTFAYWRRLAKSPYLWLGVSFFIGEFFAWLGFLALLPLSQGVLLGSVNIVVMLLLGRWLYGEILNKWRIVGCGLISAGVIMVGAG